MRLTQKNESVTIHQDTQSAELREITTMGGRKLTKKTTINLKNQMPTFNPDTMDKTVSFYIGQPIYMLYPSGIAGVTEIRVQNERDVGNYPVELVIQHNNGDTFTVNYTDVIEN